jgi:Family of unknown function (DUF6639)
LGKVVVHGAAAPDPICQAAEASLAFLGACGVAPDGVVRVDVQSQFNGHEPGMLGYFDVRAVKVVVPSFETARSMTHSHGFLGQPMSRGLYRGLVAHEVAHAVIERVLRENDHINPASHEYVAYATLFATLPPDLRKQILDFFPHQFPVMIDELSALYLALSPADFAVKAYLHFEMPGHGCSFIEGLLSGDVRFSTGLE